MPQEKGMYRPRIVDTGIVNAAPITPAFNPNEPPPIDVATLLDSLMNPAPAPTPQPVGWQDKLGGIIQAISAGIGTGLSNDPGAALLNQVQQIKAQKFAKEQQEAERRDTMDKMNRQFGMTILRDQIGEQADIRKEKRTEQYKSADREANFDLYLKKNAIEYKQDQETNKQKREYQKADMILQHQWDLEKQKSIDTRYQQTQERLENKDLFDGKLKLINAGIPAGMANSIANKMFNKEDLTTAEAKAITAAAQRALRLASRGSGGGSGSRMSGLTEKQKSAFFLSRMKDSFVKVQMPDGTDAIVEMNNAPRDFKGEIVGLKGIATDAEKMHKIADEIAAYDTIRGKNPTPDPTTKIPVSVQMQAAWDSRIQNSLDAKETPAQTMERVNSYLKENPNISPLELEAIQGALLRKNIKVDNAIKSTPPKSGEGTLDKILKGTNPALTLYDIYKKATGK